MSDRAGTTVPLDADTPCVRCGYNVRGLTEEQACPECGLGVGRSVRLGAELGQSRPAWLRGLARAAWLLLGVHLGLVAVVLAGATLMEISYLVVIGLAVTVAVAHPVAAWLLSRPENPHARPQPDWLLRNTLRLFSLSPLLIAVGLVASWWLNRGGPFLVALGVGGVLYIPCPLLEFILLRRLAWRLFDDGLAEHAAIVGWGYSLSLLVSPAVGVVPTHSGRGDTELWVLLAITVAILLFWIWACILLVVFVHAFSRAAREASSRWRVADAARSDA